MGFATQILGLASSSRAQWVQQNSGTTEALVGVAMLDSTTAVVIGSRNAILRTTDAGATWFNETAHISAVYDWSAISFCDSQNGVIVGYHRVEFTTDRGTTWSLCDVPSSDSLLSVLCVSPGAFYVGADAGWIYLTSDTGRKWSAQKISRWGVRKIFEWTGAIIAIYQTPLYALTSHSICSRSLQPGQDSWTESPLAQFQETNSQAYDAGFSYGGGPGFIVGAQDGAITSGIIIRKEMSDTTWREDTTISGGSVFAVSAPSAEVIYACGSGGLLVESTDGGDSWNQYPWPYGRDYMPNFNAISFWNKNNGFVVGDNGAIFHTSSAGGIDGIKREDTEPEHFALSQNYPNPFNPSTVIRFGVRSTGAVSLKVYDVLGRLVRTLVDKVEQPGTYSVSFDASEFPSGVYFYELVAGSHVATKKMLLLK